MKHLKKNSVFADETYKMIGSKSKKVRIQHRVVSIKRNGKLVPQNEEVDIDDGKYRYEVLSDTMSETVL